MACASCAQRRAIINQAFRNEIKVAQAVKQVAQTISTDFAKLRATVTRGQPVKFR